MLFWLIGIPFKTVIRSWNSHSDFLSFSNNHSRTCTFLFAFFEIVNYSYLGQRIKKNKIPFHRLMFSVSYACAAAMFSESVSMCVVVFLTLSTLIICGNACGSFDRVSLQVSESEKVRVSDCVYDRGWLCGVHCGW